MVTNETTKKKGRRRLSVLVALILSMCLLLTGCSDQQVEDTLGLLFDIAIEILSPDETTEGTEGSVNEDIPLAVEGEMQVHFIDVGQADATLFIQGDQVMLFDVATAGRGDDLVKYLQDLNIDYIDVLVLTHPHDDHMGGAAEVLNNIEVGKVYGPDIFDIMEFDENGKKLDPPNWYEDMVAAIDSIDDKANKGVPEDEQTSIWHLPRNEEGEFEKFNIGEAVVQFYAPFEDSYSDKNDYSICAKVSFGTVDIMLTGDATTAVEEELIKANYNLDVEIFQAGHHGSDTSNSKEFLEAMSPECIVISCGMANKYNHPVESVINLFKKMDIPVYRTDESGNIIMTTDGTEYIFSVEPGTYTSGEEYRASKGN